jgi:hypothetical protein
MNDKIKIIAGLAIFATICTFPFWFNNGKVIAGPDPVIAEEAKAAGACILPKDAMKTDHMQLLDAWRNSVVRDGNRVYVTENGKEFEMSLSNTCLECHTNKAEFCDRCHEYASVNPYCWDCHVNPKEK